jgi:hypothetical protein
MKKSEPFIFDFNSHPLTIPGYLSCQLPELVKEELQENIKKTLKNKEKVDFRPRLAGNIKEEIGLPITPKLKYLVENMAKEYFNIFGTQHCFYEDEDFKLKDLWLNLQKKHEFNPVHTHSGIFSFVIWVKVPYNLQEELEVFNHSQSPSASLFSFVYGDCYGTTHTEIIPVDTSYEWSMVFFPAKLSHAVNPFYTSDDTRMSVSGNIFYKKKKKEKVK